VPAGSGLWLRLSKYAARAPDLAAVLVLLIAPIVWFNQALWPGLSGRTMLPVDILYAFEPWHSLDPGVRAHDTLLGDLVYQTGPWRTYVKDALAAGEFPLWNPEVLTGIPFLAAAQPGVLYPLSVPFLVLPLVDAYAWYVAVHVALAGLGMYALGRTLRLRVLAALYSAVAYMFSGFVIVYAVSPQMLGVAAWLPVLLAVTELLLGDAVEPMARPRADVAWVGGALMVGVQFLAGHPEMSAYLVLTVAAYASLRALSILACRTDVVRNRGVRARVIRATAGVAALLLLGGGLAAIQLAPTAEALVSNVRQGARTLADVLGFGWPLPQLWTLLLPDLFGNPSQHQWLDIWTRQSHPVDTLFWGVKNYVEGAQYVGVLTWLLVAIALLAAILRRRAGLHQDARTTTTWIFTAIALVSLLFILGSPLYAVLEYTLPGFQQLNTPFRWILPFTASVAVLAGLGLQAVFDAADRSRGADARQPLMPLVVASLTAVTLGCLTLLAVGASIVSPEPLVNVVWQVARNGFFGKASSLVDSAFASPQMFWSYEALGLVRLGLVALLGGLLVMGAVRSGAARRHSHSWRSTRWLLLGVLPLLLTGLDLFSVHGDFFASTDARLSPESPTGRPPVVDFLDQREASSGDAQPWRFTTYNYWAEDTLKANTGMYFGWQDIRGYESIIPRQYADLMQRLRLGSNELPYARIGPFYGGGDDFSPLDNPLIDLLNVKYILTTQRLPNPRLREIYRDAALGVYENTTVYSRAFVAGSAVVTSPDPSFDGVDLRHTVLIDQQPSDPRMLAETDQFTASARVREYHANQVVVQADLEAPGWLVLTDAYAPGWRASANELAGATLELPIYRADSAFRAVYLPGGGHWTIAFTYEPTSFRAGVVISAISAMTLALIAGFRLWRSHRVN
jgi:hypothetical protein